MARWDDCPAVERDPEKLGGAWAFRGLGFQSWPCLKISKMEPPSEPPSRSSWSGFRVLKSVRLGRFLNTRWRH